jgi:hypothetical protein
MIDDRTSEEIITPLLRSRGRRWGIKNYSE